MRGVQTTIRYQMQPFEPRMATQASAIQTLQMSALSESLSSAKLVRRSHEKSSWGQTICLQRMWATVCQ